MTKHWIWVAPLLASCTYEPPLNPDFQPTNTIAGTIVADGIDQPADTIILVFDAKDPPPPLALAR